MVSARSAPFTNFLLALAHSGMSFEDFAGGASDDVLIKKWGITQEQLDAVKSGDLRRIQAQVQEEIGDDAVVAAWIGHIPWPWIGSA